MTTKSPAFRKVLLDLHGFNQPITMWWTNDQVEKLADFSLSTNTECFIRWKSTPYSIIEFPASSFKSLKVTSQNEDIKSKYILRSTLFYKYIESSHLPYPTSTFNDEFKFPVTLISRKYSGKKAIRWVDISNYVNLDLLIDMRIYLNDYLTRAMDWEAPPIPINVSLVEYSKIKL